MALKVHNTLTKKKEIFKPLVDKIVTMYNCGLTVYDFGHIGNFRAYIFADILRRYLEWKGFKVRQVMNFTDVGHMTQDDVADSKGQDKMEKAAERENKTPWEIAEFYINAFLEDSKLLNLKEPEVRPKATDHIKEQQDIIKKLLEKGHAYVSNGSVYYHVPSFKDYGKLSGNTIEQLQAGAGGRVEKNPDKKNPLDFALWIYGPKHIMSWKSPWSEKGYPGWHIECSAMSSKYLGETLDIHTGGEDNTFPHHECEIAQSEGATGKPFVKYWLHTRHLLVNGEKMSKSKGNFYTVRDLIKKGYSPMAIRYLLLSTNYRQPLNFTLEGLDAAKEVLKRIEDFMDRLREANGKGINIEILIEKTKKDFQKTMDDDLNISGALAALFDFVRDVNKKIDEGEVGKGNADKIIRFLLSLDDVLGLRFGYTGNLESLRPSIVRLAEKLLREGPGDHKTEDILRHLIAYRNELRREQDFKKADKIRDGLKAIGMVIEDENKKTKWKLK